jgi:hypothetical protein
VTLQICGHRIDCSLHSVGTIDFPYEKFFISQFVVTKISSEKLFVKFKLLNVNVGREGFPAQGRTLTIDFTNLNKSLHITKETIQLEDSLQTLR